MERNSKLKTILRNGNSISISRYINLCLYEKNVGYYHNKKIGLDFTTSPEISQMFGECISIFMISILKKIGEINNFCELGPGNGTLMKDLIKSLSAFLGNKINFFLFEKSNRFSVDSIFKDYKEFSIEKIQKLSFPSQPFFFFCNEFFDALPVNQFEKKNNIWFERRVKLENNKLCLILKKNRFFRTINENSDGSILEISPLKKLYLSKIFNHLSQFGGGFLIFDYGPFSKKKINTIQSIYNGRKSNFLENTHESDITYHIDFGYIKKVAKKFNLYFYGPISQKRFLYFSGINERFLMLSKNTNSRIKIEQLQSQFTRLTDPSGMGGLIKCVLITKENPELSFFNARS